MKLYELTYLLNPDVEQPESLAEDLVNTIKKQGADLDSKNDPSQIKLGSPIKPKLGGEVLQEALIGTIDFYLPTNQVKELQEKLEQKKEILRTMLVKKKESPEPSEVEVEPDQDQEDKKVELEDIDKKLDEILEE